VMAGQLFGKARIQFYECEFLFCTINKNGPVIGPFLLRVTRRAGVAINLEPRLEKQ
jgi:hypothetical protein